MKAEADAALQRAVTVFCRTRPEMFIFAARQEERRGNIDAARPHLKTVLDTLAPTLLAGIAAAANFERRQVCSPLHLCAYAWHTVSRAMQL